MNWEELFVQHRIIWKHPGSGPHARYSLANKHSDFYFNSDCLVSNPSLLKESADALCKEADQNAVEQPDWVVTYPPFGLNIAFCVADLLGCKFGYVQSLDQPLLNFDVRAGEKVLFCADDLYSGSSFRKVQGALAERGALLVEPLLVVANFSGASTFDRYRVAALIHKDICQWDAEHCPLCARGSAAISARNNWNQLVFASSQAQAVSN